MRRQRSVEAQIIKTVIGFKSKLFIYKKYKGVNKQNSNIAIDNYFCLPILYRENWCFIGNGMNSIFHDLGCISEGS